MQLHCNIAQGASEQAGTFDTAHTLEHPYCPNYPCWCHSDASYHSLVVSPLDFPTHENIEMVDLFCVEEYSA